jgi:hypothetical protein
MKLRIVLTLLLIGLLGCGQADDQIYDTDANPDQFPQMAVRLLEDIKADRLIGSQAITDGFGELFTEHAELLDREDWKAVIDRLGLKFGRMADSLTSLGFESYGLAAEYYQLGAFARPQDDELVRRARLFTSWLGAIDNRFVNLAPMISGESLSDDALLDITRYFVLWNTDHRRFFEAELRGAFANDFNTDPGQLSTGDQALVVTAGLTDEIKLESLVDFNTAPISLVACEVRQFDSLTYRAELYLELTGEIEADLQARVHLEFADKERLTVYFTSLPPVDQWLPGQLMAGSAIYEAKENPARVWISLYDLTQGEYVPFGPDNELFYELGEDNLIPM